VHRRQGLRVGALAVALGAALPAAGASAHVTLQPPQGRPADLQRYRVIVPNERESQATTGVDLKLPAGITFALVESVAGWHTKVVKRGSAIAELRWRGGRVPPGGYAELHFIARNPVRTGTIAWKALQRYSDGSVVRWIGSPSSDQPAPTTRLSESATPVDVVSTHGEATLAATRGGTAAPAAAASSSSSDGRDGLTLGIAIAAAVLAAAALGLQLVRRRA
jgi:uncharacterized protein YcnI